MADRVSQIALEVLMGRNSTARARVSQVSLEALSGATPTVRARVSQVALEVLRSAANAPYRPAPVTTIVWW